MKPLFIFSCPIDTYSGYGARGRDLARALINIGEYDVKILPQRWGNTPWGFIKDHEDEWGFLNKYMLPVGNQLPRQPEIWAQLTVPNEFAPIGKYNIGFTAGMETTLVNGEWIEGMNRMNINFVSSEHSKTTFLNSKWEKRDKNNNQVVGNIEIQKPIEVLFEGADLKTYMPKKSTFNLSEIEEDFAYLFVGHWMSGMVGEDRKNVGLAVKCFLETYKNKKKTPALILKTSCAGTSYLDREIILDRINQIKQTIEGARTLPNIYVLHGEFTNQEMNELYNHKKVKAMISLTKGEGFGRPLLEFSLTKKPIIATNWSGHLDFLNPEFVTLVNGEITQVHPSAANNMILKESGWFSPNTGEFCYRLRDVFENYKDYKEKAVRQAYISKSQFSFEQMESKLANYLLNAIPTPPKEVTLDLPKLTLA